MKLSVKITVLFILICFVLALSQCQFSPKKEYAAINPENHYVGINTCMQCHSGVHQTFIKTGMGQSFGLADTVKSAAHFNHQSLVDPHTGYHYQPFWKEDSLWLKEFLINHGDTVFKRIEKADFIIGSGQHTNSHITNTNGYLNQMPFTFYTQKQKLDFPPGFENGNNTRFSRKIGLECMSCHNAMPVDFVLGSENKFKKIPMGIDCERCHGPGGMHVEKIQRNELTDTSKYIDFSIVNPKKLTAEKQFQTCQRCHLQGNAVLKEGKSFLDFVPSMDLKDVMDVYLPRYSNSNDDFIMASHVDRFKMSECFIQSDNQFVCTSCHNPHVSVKETNIEQFNLKCKSCHNLPEVFCTEDKDLRALEGDNCVKCHMPKSGSTDIPHVSVHDHFIKVHKKDLSKDQVKRFLRLVAVNNNNPSKRSKIIAYLQQFEKFESNPIYLDSAAQLLRTTPDTAFYKERIHYYYLAQDHPKTLAYVKSFGWQKLLNKLNKPSYNNADAWCANRVGEAYKSIGDYSGAEKFFVKAVELAPFQLEFRNKLAGTFMLLEKLELAKNNYQYILNEYPKSAEALSNLGYINIVEGQYAKAEELILKALKLDSKYVQAQLNLASLYLATNKNNQAEELLKNILMDQPNNQRVLATLNYLEQQKNE